MGLPNSCFGEICYGLLQKIDNESIFLYNISIKGGFNGKNLDEILARRCT